MDAIIALDEFINEQPVPLLRSEALLLVIRDWLIGHGYLELEPPREDAN